jgi:signal transduction histidine kinase
MRISKAMSFSLYILSFICVQQVCGQQEILPLSLDRLNRDSLNNVIQQKEKEKDSKALAEIYGGIYAYFFDSNHKDSATSYAIKTENFSLQAGDSARYYFTQVKLGELSINAYNTEIAKAYYLKALSYYYRVKNYKMLFHVYGSLGNVYSLQKDKQNAVKYRALAVKAAVSGKDTLAQVILNDNDVHSLMEQGKLNESIRVLNKNIALINATRLLGNNEQLKIFWRGIQLNLLSECHYRKKEYALAIKYLIQVQQNDTAANFPAAQRMISSRLLVNSYIQLKVKDSAIKYANLFFEQTKKTLQNLNPEKLNEISIKYETEKKQRQIAELQQKNHLQQITASSQRKLNLAFISIIFLVLITGYLIIRNIQHKKKSEFELAKQRTELEKKQIVESERVRISAELHDDIGGELSSIRLLSEMNISNITSQQQLSKISSSSSELVQKMNEIVWALNVNNDTLQGLLAYMRRYAVKYLDDVGIDCVFTQPQQIPDKEVDGVTRRNIFLLLKEVLTNIVKHSRATNVEIAVNIGSLLQITIHDNGKGIPADMLQSGSGNGLRNMQQRVKELEGTMEIKNQEGTTVRFFLPAGSGNTKG